MAVDVWLKQKQFEAYLSATGKAIHALLGHRVQNVAPRDFQILALHLDHEYPKTMPLSEKVQRFLEKHAGKDGFSVVVDLFGERKSIMFKWTWL